MKLLKIIQDYQDKRTSDKLLKRLYSYPKEQWFWFHDSFNSWEFPIEFYDLIPAWMRRPKPNYDRIYALTRRVFDAMEKEIGNKEILRVHNVSNGGMTNEEFEYWYELDINRSVEDYYKKRQKVKKLQWWKDDVFEKLEQLNIFETV